MLLLTDQESFSWIQNICYTLLKPTPGMLLLLWNAPADWWRKFQLGLKLILNSLETRSWLCDPAEVWRKFVLGLKLDLDLGNFNLIETYFKLCIVVGSLRLCGDFVKKFEGSFNLV